MFQLTKEETEQWERLKPLRSQIVILKKAEERLKPSRSQIVILNRPEERRNRLRSQIVTLKKARGTHRKYQPYAFTEHGILMLSSVLKSPRAVQVNIQIRRTFVRLRQMLASNKHLIHRLDELEETYDAKFKIVFRAIRQLMNPTAGSRKRIGFRPKTSEEDSD